MSHVYAVLHVSAVAYAEIRARLAAVDYQHAFSVDHDGEVIDMHGIALQVEAPSAVVIPDPRCPGVALRDRIPTDGNFGDDER